MADFIRSSALLFMLLNPFLLVIYLIELFAKLPSASFRRVVFTAGPISSCETRRWCSAASRSPAG